MAVVEHGALVTRAGSIDWIGEEASAPAADQTVDLAGAWVTPGLIDCHTHLVFAGNRAGEYAERLQGASYEDIARLGGGILSTMRAVRVASEQQLFDESAPRLEALLAEGVTTVEIKSGYGLTLAGEAKMLRVARALGREYPVTIKTTLLAAHTVPPEFSDRAHDYIATIADEWLPALHSDSLVDAVDVFCEGIGFNIAQAERLFAAAKELGVPVKMHAEQLSRTGGTQLATRFDALSCDHLEYATAEDAVALARARTMPVLLPIAHYCLGGKQIPPIAAFRSCGGGMAVATDCNPGSAPGTSLLLAMSMATRLFGLTAAEALAGVTRHAARALGLGVETGAVGSSAQAGRAANARRARCGELAVGAAADFVVWNVSAIEELGYWIGFNPCRQVIRAGRVVS
jgi:imidazolonepropionase